MEFCIYCNKAIQFHKEPCHYFMVNLDDDWGMARRSDKWKEAESALRKVACEDYGHGFFPGPPYSWKRFCRRCGVMPEGSDD